MTSPGATASTPWPVVITDWALDSYLQLKHANVFTPQDYWKTLRPDVALLKQGMPPTDPKFSSSNFWGPAKLGNVILHPGHKMKWHQLGPGQVQLRLPVMVGRAKTLLCEAYVKDSDATDRRKMARFKTHMNLISTGHYVHRGTL